MEFHIHFQVQENVKLIQIHLNYEQWIMQTLIAKCSFELT